MHRRSTDDLVMLVRNGASLTMDGAARSTNDLVMIVRNAVEDSHITLTNMAARPIHDLVMIASNRVGQVTIA
jgi:hypothetical protein